MSKSRETVRIDAEYSDMIQAEAKRLGVGKSEVMRRCFALYFELVRHLPPEKIERVVQYVRSLGEDPGDLIDAYFLWVSEQVTGRKPK